MIIKDAKQRLRAQYCTSTLYVTQVNFNQISMASGSQFGELKKRFNPLDRGNLNQIVEFEDEADDGDVVVSIP